MKVIVFSDKLSKIFSLYALILDPHDIHIISILWEPSLSFLLFLFIYKIFVRSTRTYEHENDVPLNKELEHLKKFENQYYTIFDNIEEYDYSNLEKAPTYRTGFNIEQLKPDPYLENFFLTVEVLKKCHRQKFFFVTVEV